jgi:hypothetical protein
LKRPKKRYFLENIMNEGTPAPRWNAIRDDLRARRAARAKIRMMERDLASCTPAQYTELRAIVDRYDGPDAALVRDIVNRRIA